MAVETNERPVRVLLVEDNDGDIWLISKALQDASFAHTMTVVNDGAEAMKLLHRSDNQPLPDLVVLDLNLPRVNGSAVIDLLRSQPTLQHIPVVLTSSSQAANDIARARELRYAIFIRKPSDLDAFLAIGLQIKSFWEQWRERPDLAGSVVSS